MEAVKVNDLETVNLFRGTIPVATLTLPNATLPNLSGYLLYKIIVTDDSIIQQQQQV